MKKVLCVDDSNFVRNQLKKIIEEAKHSFIEAENGQNAMSALNSNPDVSLIICDVNMPVMDGLAFCRMLKEDGRIKEIPVFILSAEIRPDIKDEFKTLGVKGWLAKPLKPTGIMTVLDRYLNS